MFGLSASGGTNVHLGRDKKRRRTMRHKLSKGEQIRGLERALKNPRTPKNFRAGMRKRLAKLKG
jgi:hypothetical protein